MRSLTLPRFLLRHRSAAVVAAASIALVAGMFGIAPVRSQALTLEAATTTSEIPLDDPWAPVWDGVAGLEVPLSEQIFVAPFGGGTVDAVTARALFDDEHLYVLMEWEDDEADAAVIGVEEFSDAAALQFPGVVGTEPPYTMGSGDAPVNIWQWKAVSQADIDDGFATTQDRHPNTYADFYPDAEDTVQNPARDLGNPVAQRDRTTPIENLVAAGFGTLTTSEVQDVAGSGEWRDGQWRAVFARELGAAAEGLAEFGTDESTMVAFAVWDGGEGERNGQKSIAQFVELRFAGPAGGDGPTAQPPGVVTGDGDSLWGPILAVAGALALIGALAAAATATRGSKE